MSDKIRVAVIGACGRMGAEVVRAVCAQADMELVGVCDLQCTGMPIGEVIGAEGVMLPVEGCFSEVVKAAKPAVVIDFAKPFSLDNARLAMESGVVPIIGTTGQSREDLSELESISRRTGCAVMVIPNFAIGAVLMMRFAAEAAKYLPHVEIIELHHENKADAPSGTAIKTAELMREARTHSPETAGPKGHPARGEDRGGIHVHSVRLPGFVAHQEVIFGGQSQVLTIRHDSMDRTSFMPGVLLAVRRAAGVQGLVYGLDRLL